MGSNALDNSVSVILPIQDTDDDLRHYVVQVMEALAELADSFEVLLIDLGSSDEARDVAGDLVREFPQVTAHDPGVRSDHCSSIDAGITRATGRTVFAVEPNGTFSVSAIHRLWQRRAEEHPVELTVDSSRTIPRDHSAVDPETGLRMIVRPIDFATSRTIAGSTAGASNNGFAETVASASTVRQDQSARGLEPASARLRSRLERLAGSRPD